MNRTCSTQREGETSLQKSVKKSLSEETIQDLGLGERMILKLMIACSLIRNRIYKGTLGMTLMQFRVP
jgi:hypothetical protein